MSDGIGWMRSRPEPVKRLMRQFPPACTVKLVGPLCDEHEGLREEFFKVGSYTEDGRIGIHKPGSASRTFVEPSDIEIVHFEGDQNCEWVAEVLGDFPEKREQANV